ncbi:TadE family type IV pilus minor pilin [Pedococcus sp. NPDC057267]|uniref:TadE family type IV pilus minor pilin n=1 Tax=Pedococcus sp. NPDC057267 TaxID=3346077 RepID=UPI0036295224
MNRRPEDGMATVELAVAVPAVVLCLLMGLGAVRAVTDQVRCTDAARAAVRAAARGDSPGSAVALGRRLAPPGSTVTVELAGSVVESAVRGRPPRALRWLGAVGVPSARAVAAREDVG